LIGMADDPFYRRSDAPESDHAVARGATVPLPQERANKRCTLT